MALLCIRMLLHYYACARDYRDEVAGQHATSSAVTDFIGDLLAAELIHETNPEWKSQDGAKRFSQYSVTPKGKAMVEHLMAVQVPVCKWVQP